MRILVIDDEIVALTRMTKLFSRWGKADGANSGIEALKLFSKSYEDGILYDLITIDINIPDISGIDLIEKLVEIEKEHDPDGGWSSKKVVITAEGNLQNLQMAKARGCDDFLVKPVKLKVLEEKIKSWWH